MHRAMLVLALSAAASCKATSATADAGAAPELIPQAATFVGYWSLEALGPQYGAVLPFAVGRVAEQTAPCGVSRADWKSLTLGHDRGHGDGLAVVVRAARLGRVTTLDCLKGRPLAWDAYDDAGERGLVLRHVDPGSKPVSLTFDDGLHGWVVDEHTVVVSSESWTSDVQQLVRGSGASVLRNHELGDAIPQSAAASFWYAARPSGQASKGDDAGVLIAAAELSDPGRPRVTTRLVFGMPADAVAFSHSAGSDIAELDVDGRVVHASTRVDDVEKMADLLALPVHQGLHPAHIAPQWWVHR